MCETTKIDVLTHDNTNYICQQNLEIRILNNTLAIIWLIKSDILGHFGILA